MIYKYEWDEAKWISNHEKHGIDFLDAVAIFNDFDRIEGSSEMNGEERLVTIGVVNGVVLVVVYINRGFKKRIISARLASRKERKWYEEKRKKSS